MPTGRKRESCPTRSKIFPVAIDDLSGGQRPEQAAFQQVLLAPKASLPYRRRAALCLLVLQQPFENADRGVERGPLARRSVAVPAAVSQLLTEKPVDQSVACFSEVCATGENSPVDTGFHLALEEGRILVIRAPGALLPDQADRIPGLLTGRVQPEFPQQHQSLHGGGPALGHPGATAPISITCLEAEQPCAPALDSDPRPYGGDGLVGFVREVAHHLPADRRVRIKQPPYDRPPRLRDFTFDGCHALAPLRHRQVRPRILNPCLMHHSIEKWTGWDLNPRPLPCQDSDLPADLPARNALYWRSAIKVSLRVAVQPFSAGGETAHPEWCDGANPRPAR